MRRGDPAVAGKENPEGGGDDAPGEPQGHQQSGHAREHEGLQVGVVHVAIQEGNIGIAVDLGHHLQLVKALEQRQRVLGEGARNGRVGARAAKKRSKRQQGTLGDGLLAVRGAGDHANRRPEAGHRDHRHDGHQADNLDGSAPPRGKRQALEPHDRRDDQPQHEGNHARA